MPLAAISRLKVLNVRELRTHWGRAVASVVVVAVSATLLVAVLGVSGSITGSIDRLATSIGGDADLEVSGITGDGFDEALLGTVSSVENVTAAVPLVRMRTTANGQPALLLGLGQNAAELHSDLQTAIQDQLDVRLAGHLGSERSGGRRAASASPRAISSKSRAPRPSLPWPSWTVPRPGD